MFKYRLTSLVSQQLVCGIDEYAISTPLFVADEDLEKFFRLH